MIGRIILGALFVVIGYFFVARTEWFSDFFGVIPSAERYLGGGGTRLAYKLIGVGICILGMIVMANLYDRVIGGLVKAIFA